MLKNAWLIILILLASSVPTMAKEPAACWFDWHEVASLSSNIDVSGAFIGLTDTGILVAGGTKHSKATDTIYLLEQTGETEYRWQNIGKLPTPLAKGAAVATPEGLICLGGQGPEGISSKVFVLKYSSAEKNVADRSKLSTAAGSVRLFGCHQTRRDALCSRWSKCRRAYEKLLGFGSFFR